jgi:galactokinase
MSAIPLSAVELCLSAFSHAFSGEPEFLGKSPGRVELLGNHTDYNGGLVLAVAIDRHTVVAGRARADRLARVHSAHFRRTDHFSLDTIECGPAGDWVSYVRGVAAVLGGLQSGFASGFDAAIAGNVPIGAGLSSSASLAAAVALFLLRAGLMGQRADLDDSARLALAHLLRRSENEFVGVASGLLDQFSVLFGRAGHALSLDCRSLEYARLPLGDPSPAIVVCDTKTSRRLADGMYNRRREECERVVTYFRVRKGDDHVHQLRDIGLEDLDESWDHLDPIGRLRARHVLSENERVRRGIDILRSGDIAAFGRLMSASHASSRDDFGNSSPALDALVESAEAAPGFLGGKLSGAGWAGCTVNLVRSDQAAVFGEAVYEGYRKRTGIEPDVHVCQAAEGATAVDLR